MIPIGEFSKICCITTKTLRYYDEIGLIRPVYINKENGYRYYDISQLEIMLKINRLKSYEFSLDEITGVLCDGSEEVLMSMMAEKQNVLKSKIGSYSSLLENIQKDMDDLKKGVKLMSYLDNLKVKLVDVKPMNIIFSRQNMPVSDFGLNMNKLFARVAMEKLTMTGAPIAIYHDEEFDPAGSDIEIGIPVAEPVKGTRDLKGGLCAMVRLEGPYTELPGCYAKLVEWIDKEGYEVTSPPYESYLTGPEDDPEKHVTEIFFPVKKL